MGVGTLGGNAMDDECGQVAADDIICGRKRRQCDYATLAQFWLVELGGRRRLGVWRRETCCCRAVPAGLARGA